MINMALTLMHKEAYEQAIEIFTEVLHWDPRNCKVMLFLSNAHSKLGERIKAREYHRKFREACPVLMRSMMPRDYPIHKEFKRPGDYFIDYEHIRG